MADWDPSLYLRYADARTRPAAELAAAIPLERAARAVDLGCGPGNSTAVLAARFPGAQVLGVDASLAMVERAVRGHPQLAFRVCDITAGLEALGGGWDVVFSNACLQWVPGHRALVPALFAMLAPGGVLAVQVPMQSRQPVHGLLRQLAAGSRWRGSIARPRAFYLLEPEAYRRLLEGLTPEVHLWEAEFQQTLDSHEALLDWYRATGLRPYLAQLAPGDIPAFEADVLEGIRRLYPLGADGRVHFSMPRLFFTARRPGGGAHGPRQALQKEDEDENTGH